MTHQLTAQRAPIAVTDETDLDRLLDEATTAPVRIERNGVVDRLLREDEDIWDGYNPERVREGLRNIAGLITPEEGERLKEQIHRAREEGTRPLDRPRKFW
jgi:hypothetical protein